jgi:hypothetical protein
MKPKSAEGIVVSPVPTNSLHLPVVPNGNVHPIEKPVVNILDSVSTSRNCLEL